MATTQPHKESRLSSFPHAWTIFSLRGVPIRLDISWVLICGLVIFIFATRFSQLLGPYGTMAVIASAALATLAFFASILAHEVGHAVTSLDRGIPVSSVTLFLLGGVTESTREPTEARHELVIVGIGPFISLVLAAGFGLLHSIAPGTTPYGVVTGFLAWLNLALAVFNVLPGYPLDGGRLLRAVLWAATGRPHAATRWAARVGQGFAAVLMLGGLNGVVGGPLPADEGPLRTAVVLLAANGLWAVLIGFFLLRGALDAHRRARARERLSAVTAGQVMGALPPSLPPDLTLDEAILRVQQRPSLLWPVGTPPVGALRLEDFDAVPQDGWAGTSVATIARNASEVTVDHRMPLDAALDRLLDAPGQMLVVTDGDEPVGLLTMSLVGGLAR